MFQLTFAIITPALIVGAFAERMKFSADDVVLLRLWVGVGLYSDLPHDLGRRGWLS